MALRISRTVFSALSGTRLLACLIVAPQRGYDEPGILSYAISSFCPTSADGLHAASVSGRNGRNEFGSKQISAAPCRLDPLVVLALAAVLRRRAVAVGKLTALDDHDERNRLRLGVHRTGDQRFHANAESAPGDALGPRDRKRAGTRRE